MSRLCECFLLFAVLAATSVSSFAQAGGGAPAPDSARALGRLVVTATRSAAALEDVPIPTTIVTAADAAVDGSLRLTDLLQAIPGLALTDEFGTGVQLQGLDPAYTLVLIDGEPVIGRMSGVLDLKRLSLGGLDRVEVVRGPSSSLYGSDALAGVINLVTRAPTDFRASFGARTGTFGTTNISASAEGGGELAGRRVGARLVLERYATDGFDTNPAIFGLTAPASTEGTADVRIRAELTPTTRLRLGLRGTSGENDQSYALTDASGGVDEIDQTERRLDWSVAPEIRQALGGRFSARLSAYAAGYALDTDVVRRADGVQTYDDRFDQRILKSELQLDGLWSEEHRTIVGGGAWQDALAGERYGADRPSAVTGYGFLQHDWSPDARFALNASARLDSHTDYGTSLNPKLAMLWRPQSFVRTRLSVGTGFKAPDTRQLFLSFTNAAGGYRIYGATRIVEALARLEDEGRLAETYLDVSELGEIGAERSLAFNAEVELDPLPGVRLTVGAFRNALRDMIDVQPVAELVGGQPIYSYVNLARIRTQGLTADITTAPAFAPGLTLQAGYQWLRSRDQDVAAEIAAGSVFGRDLSGRDYRLTSSDYTNLLGRAEHQGTVRVAYRTPHAIVASVRGRIRGAYGLRDLDGNRVANRPDERVPATAIVDATVSRDFMLNSVRTGRILRAQLGVDNLFDTTRPDLVPSLAGRRVFAALSFSF